MKDRYKAKFTFHSPDMEGTSKMRAIRRHTRALAEAIDQLCPEGAEKETAITSLQTVMMQANSAIVQAYPLDPNDI